MSLSLPEAIILTNFIDTPIPFLVLFTSVMSSGFYCMHGRFITIKIRSFYQFIPADIGVQRLARADNDFISRCYHTSIYCLRFRTYRGLCLGVLLQLVHHVPLSFRSPFGPGFQFIMLASFTRALASWHAQSALDAPGEPSTIKRSRIITRRSGLLYTAV